MRGIHQSHKTVDVVYVREQGVGSVPFFFVSLSPRGPSEKIAFITMFIAFDGFTCYPFIRISIEDFLIFFDLYTFPLISL